MLALTRGDQCLGVVGAKTTAKCGKTIVCIGDTVEVGDDFHGSYSGVVVMLGHIATVVGARYRGIGYLDIKSIIYSHKNLKEGCKVPIDESIYVMKVIGLRE